MNERSETTPGLTPTERTRYARHLILPEVGVEGQLRLRRARALVVGAGGLGSPVALYLAAAGVGTIGLVDFDVVEASNLQRQILYGNDDVGRSKLDAARERLRATNPLVRIRTHAVRLDAGNAIDVLDDYDIVVDGTDNFPTRYLVNDACVLLGKPNVYGSIFRFEGQVSLFHATHGPCYRCLFPEPPAPGAVPNCAEGGVLGVLAGIIGTLQASEALRFLLGHGTSLAGRLLLFDATESRFRELSLRADPDCAVCGRSPSIHEPVDLNPVCAGDRVEPGGGGAQITASELNRRIEQGRPPRLLDVRNPAEWAICRLSGASLIPLGELESRIDEVDAADEVVVYCHSGIRSAHAVRLLRERGVARALNLVGGIDAWAAEIDPQMPRY